ncbi:Coenzyme F420 hydrogenase/dehydrogenase, beta subunit C-terminal domain [Butyrivibrio sp. VCD2006]|uniref:Coenzyme F420 hydrogenase/dehydrogenase, beta subunit C-terminal domain n=1 Tax=Butyrivibrio sp. VCD2006 TaxID=1280664 RepID=UPI00040FE28E|nr:Coenzyme F420 hydrogenase/dehydrogenase, beta subunit C-terminal domain [Butyrivibrio sp. VCD2006]
MKKCIDEITHDSCIGCRLCESVCSMNAVCFVEREGFLYPTVDKDLCILCGECYDRCPVSQVSGSVENKEIYAAKSKNDDIRFQSTSGGMFSEFANFIFDKQGSICGAVFDESWRVKHILTSRENDLKRIRRSKYSQSDMNNVYGEIKECLKKGEYVLFCGTPCQTAAVAKSLDKEYDSLFLVDFICRGVYSPEKYKDYLHDLEKEYGSDIKSVWIKNKEKGWHSLSTKIEFDNGSVYMKVGLEDSFGKEYLIYNNGIRPSCFDCKFKGQKRSSDITIGDFWGLDGTEMDDNLGTSAVIIHSDKGQELFEAIKSNCMFAKMTIEDVIRGNPSYEKSVERKS